MLVHSNTLLKQASECGYAIPSVNFVDQLSAKTYIETAERLGMPIILSAAQVHDKYISLEEAACIGKFYAEKAKVPVVLHLDHGLDLQHIKKAVELGFTSVMIDGSSYPLKENIKITKEIVDYAHLYGVSVEAEIGHVGTSISVDNFSQRDSIYTSVDEAKELCKKTGVDSLAVSIGTSHGTYKGEPKINFNILKELKSNLTVPLVLHGGSSSGDENLKKCAENGIAKINIYTDFIIAATEKINNSEKGYFHVKEEASEGMKDVLERYFKVFGTRL